MLSALGEPIGEAECECRFAADELMETADEQEPVVAFVIVGSMARSEPRLTSMSTGSAAVCVGAASTGVPWAFVDIIVAGSR